MKEISWLNNPACQFFHSASQIINTWYMKYSCSVRFYTSPKSLDRFSWYFFSIFSKSANQILSIIQILSDKRCPPIFFNKSIFDFFIMWHQKMHTTLNYYIFITNPVVISNFNHRYQDHSSSVGDDVTYHCQLQFLQIYFMNNSNVPVIFVPTVKRRTTQQRFGQKVQNSIGLDVIW